MCALCKQKFYKLFQCLVELIMDKNYFVFLLCSHFIKLILRLEGWNQYWWLLSQEELWEQYFTWVWFFCDCSFCLLTNDCFYSHVLLYHCLFHVEKSFHGLMDQWNVCNEFIYVYMYVRMNIYTYRMRHKLLTDFDIRKPTCQPRAPFVLTVLMHSDVWSLVEMESWSVQHRTAALVCLSK